LPVAVIGGGPVGLAAAVHLLAQGLEPAVLEAGPSAGTSARAWGHVRMFSPWRYNIDKAARVLLERHGWTAPDPDAFPTGRDLAEAYLDKLAALPEIAPRLRLGTRVIAVARAGVGKVRDAGREAAPFEVRVLDADGNEASILARAVIDASGTWSGAGWAGAAGIPAVGERAAFERVRYGMPDVLSGERGRYEGKRVMVVGSGDSALGTLIDLAALARQTPGAGIVWAARNADLRRAFGGGAADQLPERGALGLRVRKLVEEGAIAVLKPFAIEAIACDSAGALRIRGHDDLGTREVTVDEMVVCTGFRPNLEILREARLDLDPKLECPAALAPLIDPNVHSCGTVRPHGAVELEQPETGLFIVGMKSYGRAPTFLLATGYEQVRSVAAWLAGDLEAARRVELDLPETGVCGSDLVADAATPCCAPAIAATTCCAPATPAPVSACCANARKRIAAEPAE
jgi:thioredoxin reductase